MTLQPCQLDQLSDATSAYARGTLPRSNGEVLMVTLRGTAANSRRDAGTYRFASAAIIAGLEAWRPDGLILDFRELAYEWGDPMQETLTTGRRWYHPHAASDRLMATIFNGRAKPDEFPVLVVTSDACRDGLTSLLCDEMGEDPARWLFDSPDAALAALDELLLGPRAA